MQDTEKHNNRREDTSEKQASRQAGERTYPRSVPALLRQCQRSERGRLRREAFRQQTKADRETMCQDNARLRTESEYLRRENASALRLVLHMTRRYERLRRYTETLHDWITAGTPIDNKSTGTIDPDRSNGAGNEP